MGNVQANGAVHDGAAHSGLNPEDYLQSWQPQSLSQGAVTLPREMYLSPGIYRLEQEKFFGKTWCYVGHISQLEGPGSYFTVEVAEQPLVIVQDKAGALRAFFNVCTHRAGPVALGSGKCSRLTCLYHAWSFDLQGGLRGMPEMDGAEAFDVAAHALTAVQVDTWESLIFVNLDPAAEPLAAQLGELPQLFQRYRLGNWARVHSVDYWTDSNWKLFVENNAESYHEPTVHPILAKYYQHIKASAQHFYYLQYTPFLSKDDLVFAEQPGTFATGLNAEELGGVWVVTFFPNCAWVVTPNCAIFYLIDPQGPSKTRIRLDWLVPDTEEAKAADNLEPLIQFYDQIQQEDLELLPEIQKRIQSLGYVQGRLSPAREMGTHLFQELMMQHLTAT